MMNYIRAKILFKLNLPMKTSQHEYMKVAHSRLWVDCEQPPFSLDLERGVHARASVERRSHTRGHLCVSSVLLDGPRKKRD